MTNRFKLREDRGFSFIELVITVAVVGILTAIAVPSYGAIQHTAKANATKNSAQTGYSQLKAAEASGLEEIASVMARLENASPEVRVTATQEQDDFCVIATWTNDDSVPVATRGECDTDDEGTTAPGTGGGPGTGTPAPTQPGQGSEQGTNEIAYRLGVEIVAYTEQEMGLTGVLEVFEGNGKKVGSSPFTLDSYANTWGTDNDIINIEFRGKDLPQGWYAIAKIDGSDQEYRSYPKAINPGWLKDGGTEQKADGGELKIYEDHIRYDFSLDYDGLTGVSGY